MARAIGRLGILALTALATLAAAGCGAFGGSEPALEQAVGQMLMVGFRGERLEGEAAAMLRDIKPGGVVLYDYDGPTKGELTRNIASREQLRALIAELQAQAETPYFIAIDAEGGYVNRLKSKYGFAVDVPSAQEMGAADPASTAAIADALAREMKDIGVNWNFAPVVDVNINPESPAIGAIERSFSGDPGVVAAHARAFIDAHRAQQIITALKHFPGHGSAAGDTHLGVADVTDTYQRAAELAPYMALIGEGYDSPIMTAHIVNRNMDADARPATLSRAIMTTLLRDEIGFEGVVISDDMQMGAIVEEYGLADAAIAAINAGVDIVMLANQQGEYDLGRVYRVRDAILQAVADGAISEERIRQSAERIAALKREYGIMP